MVGVDIYILVYIYTKSGELLQNKIESLIALVLEISRIYSEKKVKYRIYKIESSLETKMTQEWTTIGLEQYVKPHIQQ